MWASDLRIPRAGDAPCLPTSNRIEDRIAAYEDIDCCPQGARDLLCEAEDELRRLRDLSDARAEERERLRPYLRHIDMCGPETDGRYVCICGLSAALGEEPDPT